MERGNKNTLMSETVYCGHWFLLLDAWELSEIETSKIEEDRLLRSVQLFFFKIREKKLCGSSTISYNTTTSAHLHPASSLCQAMLWPLTHCYEKCRFIAWSVWLKHIFLLLILSLAELNSFGNHIKGKIVLWAFNLPVFYSYW